MTDTTNGSTATVEQGRLELALGRLLAEGRLDSGQCEAVRDAYAHTAPPVTAPQAPATAAPVVHEVTVVAEHGLLGAGTPARMKDRLLEAAGYLGAILVAASLVALIAQYWEDLTRAQQVATLGAFAAVALAVGLVVVRTAAGGRAALLETAQAPRRRIASVALVGAAVLAGIALGIALPDDPWSAPATFVVVLLLIGLAQYLAPSALSEAGLLFASALLLTTTIDAAIGAPPEDTGGVEPAEPVIRAIDYVTPIAVSTLGVLWAAFVAPRLRLPQMSRVLALGGAFVFALPLLAQQGTRTAGLILLAVLTAVGLAVYLRSHLWPWLAMAALSAAAFVVRLVGSSAGTAMGLLAAGVILLAAVAVIARRSRRAQVAADTADEATAQQQVGAGPQP